MSEQQPHRHNERNTIVASDSVVSFLGKQSIDAARLDWRLSPNAKEGAFAVAVANTLHANQEPRILMTKARIIDSQIEFEEYPPDVLIYTMGEWDAFIHGAKDNEFDDM
jgi:hypothetical protein